MKPPDGDTDKHMVEMRRAWRLTQQASRMRTLKLALLSIMLWQLVAAEELPSSLLTAVHARLRAETSASDPVLLATQSCSRQEDSPISTPDFSSKYPHGLYIACDATFSGKRSTITILYYLFHYSRGKPMVAKRIEAELVSRGKNWYVRTWSTTAIDYAPK